MKLDNSDNKIVLVCYVLFFFVLPYLRYLALEETNIVLPLSIPVIVNAETTLSYMRIYGGLTVAYFIFLKAIVPHSKQIEYPRYHTIPFYLLQVLIMIICLFYFLFEINISFLNVFISSLMTFVVATLGYLTIYSVYKLTILLIAVLTTGRGLVAVFIFYKLLKSSLITKVMLSIGLVIFMLALDMLRNGLNSSELISFMNSINLDRLALVTYSFPFFDMVNGVQSHVQEHGTRNVSEFYTNLWFHIPRALYPDKPFLYGDEIALTQIIFNVDPRVATLAITSAGIAKIYYGEFALILGPIIDAVSILFSFIVINRVFRSFTAEAVTIVKIFVLIKIMRNGQEYLFTSFLWLLLIVLIINYIMNNLSKMTWKPNASD